MLNKKDLEQLKKELFNYNAKREELIKKSRDIVASSKQLIYAVHRDDSNPIYGEQTTHVSVEDEAGGAFIVLRQFSDHPKLGEVRLEMDELETILRVSRRLMRGMPLDADPKCADSKT